MELTYEQIRILEDINRDIKNLYNSFQLLEAKFMLKYFLFSKNDKNWYLCLKPSTRSYKKYILTLDIYTIDGENEIIEKSGYAHKGTASERLAIKDYLKPFYQECLKRYEELQHNNFALPSDFVVKNKKIIKNFTNNENDEDDIHWKRINSGRTI